MVNDNRRIDVCRMVLAKQLEDFLPESRDSRGTRRQLNGWKRGESRDGAKSRRSVPACVGDCTKYFLPLEMVGV
ncbi:hypothetical protein MGG_16320 [Pyricularia oryzae 70-15]|uniref:Uncharacterized protein n=2 Tax=Pyricularia oryzae TaxID=318829 RepID=G4MKE3_PYRO7|nr:uncharacterized protein MGG_16320 [Pyricularia oryzae 70-15]EHA57532.1 hypothetical protein MGG_16320 [Pyricularia oryzae 70-15]